MCLQKSENCKSLVLQDKCNIEIFLSPEDDPQALASGLSSIQVGGQPWYSYFIPPT